MATTSALIPIEQYLHSDYEPDAEYVDGALERRPAGEYDHCTWQQAIEQWFLQHAREWNIRVRCELRVQVSPTRFRVPEVVVFDRTRPVEQILTHPPIAVFEVLSPEDTTSRLLSKLDDYEHMGIQGIFVVDPQRERTFQYKGGDLLRCPRVVQLTGTQHVVDWTRIADLFDLD